MSNKSDELENKGTDETTKNTNFKSKIEFEAIYSASHDSKVIILLIAGMLVLTLSSIISLISDLEVFASFFRLNNTNIPSLLSPIGYVIVFMSVIVGLLEVRKYKENPPKNDYLDTAGIERAVAYTRSSIANEVQKITKTEVAAKIDEIVTKSGINIRESINEKIDNKISDDLIHNIDEILAKKIHIARVKLSLTSDTNGFFDDMIKRNMSKSDEASRSAELFRFFGTWAGITGIIIFFAAITYSFLQIPKIEDLASLNISWRSIIFRYGPVYGFVALCEFLALIMFRYYSKSLEQMRYFINESVNLDYRRIAFMTSLEFMDTTNFKDMLDKFVATERNFLMAKDQKTVEMANNEHEVHALDRFMAYASALNKFQKEKEK